MEKKSNIYASIATVVFAVLLLIFLLRFGMSFSKEERLEGLMVSFGDELEGFGEQTSIAESSSQMPLASANDEKLVTQEEESVDLHAEQKKEKKRKQAEEERRMKEAATQKMVAGAFGNSNSMASSGTTTGDAMSGNPIGKGNSGGHSWSLAGRSLVGNLSEPPYIGKQEGKVVVAIRVDSNGDVTGAKIANGTTISDSKLREAARQAAEKAKFSSGQSVAVGEIIYRFVLN